MKPVNETKIHEVLLNETVVNIPVRVLDITVQDNHNYFIKAGNVDILSHNCLEFVIQEILGPVVVVSRTTSLVPEIQVVNTGVSWKESKLWAHSISNMLKSEAKNNLLLEHLFIDLKEHPCIIIPTDRVEHLRTLLDLINKEAVKRNLTTPENAIASGFYGAMLSKEKSEVLKRVDEGSCKVLVSMRSMIKQGIDLKIPTMLYSIIPETATVEAGSPMFLQLSNRPCTPHLNKKQPVVKIFVDNTNLSHACFKSLFLKEIKPNLVANVANNYTVRYKLNEESLKIAYELLKAKSESAIDYFTKFNASEVF
jgi:hypothetical protein